MKPKRGLLGKLNLNLLVSTVCFSGVGLTYVPVEGSPGGREPGLRTGELVGLQSSGKGFGMAGREDVLSCCSCSCNLLMDTTQRDVDTVFKHTFSISVCSLIKR